MYLLTFNCFIIFAVILSSLAIMFVHLQHQYCLHARNGAQASIRAHGVGLRSAQHYGRIGADVAASWQKSRLVRVKNEQEGGRLREEELCLCIAYYQQK